MTAQACIHVAAARVCCIVLMLGAAIGGSVGISLDSLPLLLLGVLGGPAAIVWLTLEYRRRTHVNRSGNPYNDYYDLFERYPHVYTAAGMVTSASMFDTGGRVPAAAKTATRETAGEGQRPGTDGSATGAAAKKSAPARPRKATTQ